MKEFNNRVAVITGAASGIGYALAAQLAQKGCHLALADISENNLNKAKDTLSAAHPDLKITTHIVDVSSRTVVEAFAENVVAEHQQVHMLFNNAGVTAVEKFESISYEDFSWVMNINFWGVVYGTKAFLAHLQQADEAHIINTSSLFGFIANPRQTAYNASKFAVRGFTESLKMELATTNVRVSSVHPGGIKTNIVENAKVNLDNLTMDKKTLSKEFDKQAPTTAAEAAATILKGVSKNKRRIVVGKDAKIADLISRWFPNSYEKILKLESR